MAKYVLIHAAHLKSKALGLPGSPLNGLYRAGVVVEMTKEEEKVILAAHPGTFEPYVEPKAEGEEVTLSSEVVFALEWVVDADRTLAIGAPGYPSDATLPQGLAAADMYEAPTAQLPVSQQPPYTPQQQPYTPQQQPYTPQQQPYVPQQQPYVPQQQTRRRTSSGSGLSWLFVGCGVFLFFAAAAGMVGALMFTNGNASRNKPAMPRLPVTQAWGNRWRRVPR